MLCSNFISLFTTILRKWRQPNEIKNFSLAFLASATLIGYSNAILAQPPCYEVEGTIATVNVSPTQKIGEINLTLSTPEDEDVVFNETCSLVGNIIGTDGFGATLLTHAVECRQGNFVTENDTARLVAPFVRTVLEDGTACSFYIRETVNNLIHATKFFKTITNVNVVADGYVSNCHEENGNYFELSGTFCRK